MRWSLYLLLCLALVWGCREDELEPRPFFEVSIEQPVAGATLGTLELSALISQGGDRIFEDYGFFWSENLAALEGEAVGAQRLPKGQKDEEGRFKDTLTGLDLNKAYFFRAYASSGLRMVLSDTIASFSFEFRLKSDTIVEIYNDQAWLSGFVSGLQNLRASVQEHGHIRSLTNKRPVYHRDSASLLGPIAIDASFDSHFEGLEFNTTYYAWAYVKTESDLYLSDEPVVFRTRDGWRPNQAFPKDITYALAQSIDNKGYLVFGCTEFELCKMPGNIHMDLWEFDPAENDSWKIIGAVPNLVALRFGGVSFVIGSELFIGFGQDASGSILSDFLKINPEDMGQWQVASLYENDTIPFERRDAVAFVINDKAYIGTGLDSRGRLLSDFWEFNPSKQGSAAWRRVASLKYLEEGTADTTYEGRINAAAFTLGDCGFVGGGASITKYLADFWKFYPPASSQDSGRWEFHSFFPEEPRTFAVAFTIDEKEKAYYGMGLSDNQGFHNDFWEFTPTVPAQEPWRNVTEFQGAPRELAIGFSIGNIGYVGTGDSLVIQGRSTVPKSTRDFWTYYPEE